MFKSVYHFIHRVWNMQCIHQTTRQCQLGWDTGHQWVLLIICRTLEPIHAHSSPTKVMCYYINSGVVNTESDFIGGPFSWGRECDSFHWLLSTFRVIVLILWPNTISMNLFVSLSSSLLWIGQISTLGLRVIRMYGVQQFSIERERS
jgi:hypothetical protein